jgi:hypothetical protein
LSVYPVHDFCFNNCSFTRLSIGHTQGVLSKINELVCLSTGHVCYTLYNPIRFFNATTSS